MRLYEVADRFASDLETVLRNLVGRSDSKYSKQHLSYFALSNLLKNLGYGAIRFEDFSRLYDETPAIQNLVADFNRDGITLGTEKDIQDVGSKTDMSMSAAPEPAPQTPPQAAPQMEQRTTRRRF